MHEGDQSKVGCLDRCLRHGAGHESRAHLPFLICKEVGSDLTLLDRFWELGLSSIKIGNVSSSVALLVTNQHEPHSCVSGYRAHYDRRRALSACCLKS